MVVLAAVVFQLPLVLGLEPKDIAMLALTFLTSAVTLGTGRTYMMQGAVHLLLFVAFYSSPSCHKRTALTKPPNDQKKSMKYLIPTFIIIGLAGLSTRADNQRRAISSHTR